jgi:hypothetical protein
VSPIGIKNVELVPDVAVAAGEQADHDLDRGHGDHPEQRGGPAAGQIEQQGSAGRADHREQVADTLSHAVSRAASALVRSRGSQNSAATR